MALSNRFTPPLSLVKPLDPAEEETDIETGNETEVEPFSEQVTRPFKALMTVEPQEESAYQPDPAELNPALFAAEADTNPMFSAIPVNNNPMLPVIRPAEMPL